MQKTFLFACHFEKIDFKRGAFSRIDCVQICCNRMGPSNHFDLVSHKESWQLATTLLTAAPCCWTKTPLVNFEYQ